MLYAEDSNYFKTSQTQTDTWLDRVEDLVSKYGGSVYMRTLAKHEDMEAYCIEFELGGESFRIVWPVLPVKQEKNRKAARIQAATSIFHDIKNRALRLRLFGAKIAFYDFRLDSHGNNIVELPNLQAQKRLSN